MSNFDVIGKNVIKKDAISKVTGKALFSSDYEFENMLHAKVLRSEVVSAKIIGVDTSKAKELPGVACVLTHKDIPGENRVGIIIKDEPVLVEDKIRRVGDAIALVAAETVEIAEKALELISVEYEELPVVTNIFEAMKEDSPKVHGDTNILMEKNLVKGDVEEAFKKCDVIVENTYKTPAVAHMFIEPEAGVAKFERGKVTFWCSTQNPHFDRGEVARVLALPQSKVRGVRSEVGGGFGGKLDISVQCHIGLLAYYTKRPVKLVFSREESMKVSSKRHPHIMKVKTGATEDGKLLAMEAVFYADTGAYSSYGPAVVSRAMVHATGPYEIPNVKIKSTMMYTNNPMCGAMRGFGVPQVAIAHESQIDMIAEKLNISSYEIRLINALRYGSKNANNQIMDNSVGIVKTLEAAKKKADEILK
ncbi:molybdopterin cofactor-binding domain-containing protein [uncultured Ilyobacter sp.]|uniref:xanthine dehydrogenase family protein molybdopterin-binding subunit n=1 Tax=uncultured Ilyobacter sp. TaxID=544433 RepID=UPI002AA7016D|nr:molybdopterin cofactor-binding domain-containing protein [uncultured Ilyobacter sp.]